MNFLTGWDIGVALGGKPERISQPRAAYPDMKQVWNASNNGEEKVNCYVSWLRPVPWQLFATFTFAWPVSDTQASGVFRGFINRLEKAMRQPVAFVRGDEKRYSGCGMPGAPRHFHAVLTAHRKLDRFFVADLWMSMAGQRENDSGADVRIYNPQLGGLAYVLKFINESHGDWDFRNLDLFLPKEGIVQPNRRQRRRLSRHERRCGNEERGSREKTP